MVNKFDTQFLIEGSNLDEDDIRAGIMASAEGECITTPILPGRCWNTPPARAICTRSL